MWDGWFRTIPNLLGVFNGHYITDNIAYRIDPNDAGRKVLQGFDNWQEAANGGSGRVVLFTVDEDAGTIQQRVVRPDLDDFETGSDNGYQYATTHEPWTPALPPVDPGHYVVQIGSELFAVNDGGTPSAVHIPG
jgi:hypothetical protein